MDCSDFVSICSVHVLKHCMVPHKLHMTVTLIEKKITLKETHMFTAMV